MKKRGTGVLEQVGRTGGAERHASSGTAVAAESLRTGVAPNATTGRRSAETEIPGQDERLEAGDPDTSALGNQYVGDETPGGHMSTPDQDGVDDIGRVYGVQDADNGDLHATSEVLDQRDRKRQELEAPEEPGEI